MRFRTHWDKHIHKLYTTSRLEKLPIA